MFSLRCGKDDYTRRTTKGSSRLDPCPFQQRSESAHLVEPSLCEEGSFPEAKKAWFQEFFGALPLTVIGAQK